MDRNHCKLETGLEKHLPVLVVPVLQQQDAIFFFYLFHYSMPGKTAAAKSHACLQAFQAKTWMCLVSSDLTDH